MTINKPIIREPGQRLPIDDMWNVVAEVGLPEKNGNYFTVIVPRDVNNRYPYQENTAWMHLSDGRWFSIELSWAGRENYIKWNGSIDLNRSKCNADHEPHGMSQIADIIAWMELPVYEPRSEKINPTLSISTKPEDSGVPHTTIDTITRKEFDALVAKIEELSNKPDQYIPVTETLPEASCWCTVIRPMTITHQPGISFTSSEISRFVKEENQFYCQSGSYIDGINFVPVNDVISWKKYSRSE